LFPNLTSSKNSSLVGLHFKWRDVASFGYILDGAIRRLAISLFIGYKAYASAKKTLYDDGHRRPRGAAD
jgi:hypothetical protein